MTTVAGQGKRIDRGGIGWRAFLLLTASFGAGLWLLTEVTELGWLIVVVFGFDLILVMLHSVGSKDADPLRCLISGGAFVLFPIIVLGLDLSLGVGFVGWILVWFALAFAADCVWTLGPGKNLAVRRTNAWLLGREMPVE